MALNTITLSNALKAAFLANLSAPTTEQSSQVATMCDSIAAAMQSFVESATINYSAGLVAPSGGGPVTGIFGSTIS